MNLANSSSVKNPRKETRKHRDARSRKKKTREKTESLLTDTRGPWRINHFSFLLSRAISPRFKHSADASAPLLSAIRYMHARAPLSTTAPSVPQPIPPPPPWTLAAPFLSDIRFPNISLLLPVRRSGARYTVSSLTDVVGMYRSA